MSTRQTILTLVDTAMKAIRTANGKNTNIGRNVMEWGQRTDGCTLPALFWRDLTSRVEHEGVSFNRQRHFMTVEIEFAVAGTTSPADARKILEDIVASVYANRKWGGNARWTSVDEHDLSVSHEDKKITGGRVACVIEYDTDLGQI